MDNELYNAFLSLVRLGIGISRGANIPQNIDWQALKALAGEQGLTAIVLDGIEQCQVSGFRFHDSMPQMLRLEWIGEMLQIENSQSVQWKAQCELALLLRDNQIKTYVLKGAVVSECYPNPTHRQSVDMDCFLLSTESDSDVWERGNKIIEERSFVVERIHYKNSTWFLPGLTVENHRFLTPFRGNNTLKKLEQLFQTMLYEDKCDDNIEDTWLYRPPVMVTALFLIEHAYSHFLHEGLTWRHVLDWMMFSRKHEKEIDWGELDLLIDEYGFRKFYDPFYRLGLYLLGETNMNAFTIKETMMLEDVWDDLALHDTALGVRGKLALAGNTIRAWWKYHHFSDISMLHALWIQTTGYLFDKHPNLD